MFPVRHVSVTAELAEVLDPLWEDLRLAEPERIGRGFWFRT